MAAALSVQSLTPELLPYSCLGLTRFLRLIGGICQKSLQRFWPIKPHLQVWLWTSDQGPDQKGCNNIVRSEVSDNLFIWMFRQWCVLHVLHLMTSKQIKRLTQPHWSIMAKIANCWRASGCAAKIYKCFHDIYGAAAAKVLAGKVPPRCLTGRWASLTDLERFLLPIGQEKLARVWDEVFKSNTKKKKGKGDDNRAQCMPDGSTI